MEGGVIVVAGSPTGAVPRGHRGTYNKIYGARVSDARESYFAGWPRGRSPKQVMPGGMHVELSKIDDWCIYLYVEIEGVRCCIVCRKYIRFDDFVFHDGADAAWIAGRTRPQPLLSSAAGSADAAVERVRSEVAQLFVKTLLLLSKPV